MAKKILIIDDEELARFAIREALESLGHVVDEATDGEMGVTMARGGKYDLVVTDIIMPRKEGVETLIQLKQEHPGLKVIAVSGGGRTQNMDFLKAAAHYGADALLAKPFSTAQLRDALDAAFG